MNYKLGGLMENERSNVAQPIILRESRSKLVVWLAVAILFTVGAVWLMERGEFLVGLGAAVFCGAASIGLIAQFRTDRIHSLRIDSTGLTYYNFFRSGHVPWQDIASFGVTRITTAAKTLKFVAWNYLPEAPRPAKRVFLDMTLLGFDAGCPAIGLPAEDLLALLRNFHHFYAKVSG